MDRRGQAVAYRGGADRQPGLRAPGVRRQVVRELGGTSTVVGPDASTRPSSVDLRRSAPGIAPPVPAELGGLRQPVEGLVGTGELDRPDAGRQEVEERPRSVDLPAPWPSAATTIGTRASISSHSVAASCASSVPARISSTTERGSGGSGRKAHRPGDGEASAIGDSGRTKRGDPARGGQRTAALGERQTLPPPVVEAFLLSFGVIFVAELGDKSQLMALTFATRYRALPVLIGITIATALVHLVSVAIGATLGRPVCRRGDRRSLGGLAFLGFAAWTLRGDSLDEDEDARRPSGPPARSSSPSASRSSSPSSATRRCSRRSRWPPARTLSACGSVRRRDGRGRRARHRRRPLARHAPARARVRIGAAVPFLVFGIALIVGAIAG